MYDDVLEELRRGRKSGHWIWFIFPQIAGLGQSAMSQRYAIRSLEEARAYLAHPVLGARLRECAELVLEAGGRAGVSAGENSWLPGAQNARAAFTPFRPAGPAPPVFGALR